MTILAKAEISVTIWTSAVSDGALLFEPAAILTLSIDLVPEQNMGAKPATVARTLHEQSRQIVENEGDT